MSIIHSHQARAFRVSINEDRPAPVLPPLLAHQSRAFRVSINEDRPAPVLPPPLVRQTAVITKSAASSSSPAASAAIARRALAAVAVFNCSDLRKAITLPFSDILPLAMNRIANRQPVPPSMRAALKAQLHSKTELSLKKIQDYKTALGSKSWEEFFKFCPNLLELYCADSTDATLKSLIPHLPSGLTSIYLRSCDVEDADIIALTIRCPLLRFIKLWWCTDILDDALIALSECTLLEHVSLTHCQRISDAGVIALSKCPLLRNINLSDCTISDTGLIALSKCPLLRNINLSGCGDVTPAGLKALEKIPKLKIES